MSKFIIFLFAIVCMSVIANAEERATWDPAHPGNYTVGRGGNGVKYVIIHVVQGSYKGCISWFKNSKAKVSAHYVVSNAGDITQMVKEADTAWHAGNWSYNQRSIGIEHEGYVTNPSFPDAMYRNSAALVRAICKRHNIPMDRNHIIGHVEVPGATHTDPGNNWNWSKFMSYVKSREEAVPAQENASPEMDEYKIRINDIEFGVEKIQKTVTAQEREAVNFTETVTAANLFETDINLSSENLEKYLSFDCCRHNFPEAWSGEITVQYPREQEKALDLVYVYDKYNFEVWFKVSGGEWMQIGSGSAYAFRSHKLAGK